MFVLGELVKPIYTKLFKDYREVKNENNNSTFIVLGGILVLSVFSFIVAKISYQIVITISITHALMKI